MSLSEQPKQVQQRLVLNLLRQIGVSIRIPTATWLLSDVLGVLDGDARQMIGTLKDCGYLTTDNGGWITVTKKMWIWT